MASLFNLVNQRSQLGGFAPSVGQTNVDVTQVSSPVQRFVGGPSPFGGFGRTNPTQRFVDGTSPFSGFGTPTGPPLPAVARNGASPVGGRGFGATQATPYGPGVGPSGGGPPGLGGGLPPGLAAALMAILNQGQFGGGRAGRLPTRGGFGRRQGATNARYGQQVKRKSSRRYNPQLRYLGE